MDDSVSDSTYSRNEVTLRVDLAGWTNVVLTFWAKEFADEPHGPPTAPFTNGADFDGVAISTNGVLWYEAASLRSLSSSNTLQTVNFNGVLTAKGLRYTSPFFIRFNQYDNAPISTDGIAIDDISLTGIQSAKLSVTVPMTVTETDGLLAGGGLITLFAPLTNDVVVTLQTAGAGGVQVPAQVTLVAGETNASFDLFVADDTILNGTRVAMVSAGAPLLGTNQATMTIRDNETATLGLILPSTITEGTGVLSNAGEVVVSAPVATNVTVTLASGVPARLALPASVVVPIGSTSAWFNVTAPDNSLVDGPIVASASAQVDNWTTGTALVTITDNESTNLTLTLPASAVESSGVAANAGAVSLGGTAVSNVVVSLLSSDSSELLVPATVTIPAGTNRAFFSLTFVDDSLVDGPQTVTVTAQAPGFGSATNSMIVDDDELHHFDFAPVASPQTGTVAFAVHVFARNLTGTTLTSFTNRISFACAATGGGQVAMITSNSGNFTSGQWSGTVRVDGIATNAVLTASFTNGASGQSAPFNLVPPAVLSVSNTVSDLAYEKVSGRLCAGGLSSTNANRLILLNPDTLFLVGAVPLGGTPGRIALAGNGQFAYVALTDTNAIVRVNLSNLTADLRFTIGDGLRVDDLKVMPGNSHAVAVSRMNPDVSPRHAGVVIYDDGAPRSVGAMGFSGANTIEFGGGPSVLYGYDNELSSFEFITMQVDGSGVSITGASGLWSGFGQRFEYDSGRVFSTTGIDADPVALQVLGDFVVNGAVEPGLSEQRVFFVSGARLKVFDSNTRLPLSDTTIPGVSVGGDILVRCSGSALAFHTGGNQIFVVRTPWRPTQPAADLRLAMNVSPSPAWLGSNLVYSITVTNSGPANASNVVVTFRPPQPASLNSPTLSQGTFSNLTGGYSFQLGLLSNAAVATISVPMVPLEAGYVEASASVTSFAIDPNLSNNCASAFTLVGFAPAPDSIHYIKLSAADIAYDPYSQRLYASYQGSDWHFTNGVVPIDPLNGLLETPVLVGLGPRLLAATGNGQYLYIGVDGEQAIRRVILPSRTPELRIDLQGVTAVEIEPIAGSPQSIVVVPSNAGSPPVGPAVVYDNAVPRPVVTSIFTPVDSLEPSDNPTRFYGYDSSDTGFGFYRLDVTSNGITATSSASLWAGFGIGFEYDKGRVFSVTGVVADPEAGIILGQLEGMDFLTRGSLCPAQAEGRIYALQGTNLYSIEPNLFRIVGRQAMTNLTGEAGRLVRWGSDGLAFTGSEGRVHIVRTPLVPSAPPANWALGMSVSTNLLVAGNTVTYQIYATNFGPNTAAGSRVLDWLPAGAELVSSTTTHGAVSAASGLVTATLGDVPAGVLAQVSLTVRLTTPGTNLNSAAILADSVDAAWINNAATVSSFVIEPEITLHDVTGLEGNVGTRDLPFMATLSFASAETVTVQFATSNLSALPGRDYLPLAGTLVFPPGVIVTNIRIPIVGNIMTEGDEAFAVILSHPTNATIARDLALGTILNDDGFPGQIHHFEWSGLPATLEAGRPYVTTVRARDSAGNTATNFSGPASLSAQWASGFPLNADFEGDTLSPWTPLNGSGQPGPYELFVFDVDGDGIATTAFRTLHNLGSPDGIAQSLVLRGGTTYEFDLDFAVHNEGLGTTADPGTCSIFLNTNQIASASVGNSFGDIYGKEILRTNLHGAYTPPSNGTYTVAITLYRDFGQDGQLWAYVDNLRVRTIGLPALPMLPATPVWFTNGTWSGPLGVLRTATNIFLTTDDGDGHTGDSLSLNIILPADSDGDGLPDWWELLHGLNPNSGADASNDTDGDGFSNYAEYLADTDPQDAGSYLRVTSIASLVGDIRIEYAAGSAATSILQRTLSTPGSWINLLTNPPGSPTNVFLDAVGTNPSLLYRIQSSRP